MGDPHMTREVYRFLYNMKCDGCTVRLFNRRKCMTKYISDINQIKSELIHAEKWEMIVFEMNNDNIQELLDVISNSRKTYSPLIKTDENKIYYFPKSNYSDVYLLKDVFQDNCGRNIDIYMGNNII